MSFFIVLGVIIVSAFFYTVTLLISMNVTDDVSNDDGLKGAIGLGLAEAIIIGVLLAKMKGMI